MRYQGLIRWHFAPMSSYSTRQADDQGLMRDHVKGLVVAQKGNTQHVDYHVGQLDWPGQNLIIGFYLAGIFLHRRGLKKGFHVEL